MKKNEKNSLSVDAYNGYNRVIDEFQFDSLPKVNLEFKWTKLEILSFRMLSITINK